MAEETSAAPVETSEAPEADDSEILETEEPETETEEDSEPEPKKESSPQKPKAAPKGKDEEEQKDETKKEPPKKPKKVVRGKVDDEEVDIELEPEEVEAFRAKQMTIAAQRRFQEAAELRKQADKVLETLKADPFAALKQAGLDVDGLVEKYALDFVQRQQMTPEQREAMELRQKLESIEKEREAQAKQEEEATFQEERKRLMVQLDKEFASGAKAAGLPPSPQNISRMAAYVRAANEQGYDLDPEEAAERVREELQAEHQHLFGSLDGEELLSALGNDVVEKVRRTLVAKAKAKRGTEPQVVTPRSQPRDPQTQRFTSVNQMLRGLPAEYRR